MEMQPQSQCQLGQTFVQHGIVGCAANTAGSHMNGMPQSAIDAWGAQDALCAQAA